MRKKRAVAKTIGRKSSRCPVCHSCDESACRRGRRIATALPTGGKGLGKITGISTGQNAMPAFKEDLRAIHGIAYNSTQALMQLGQCGFTMQSRMEILKRIATTSKQKRQAA